MWPHLETRLPAFESRLIREPLERHGRVDAIDKARMLAGYIDARDSELSGRVALSHVWPILRNT
jgi:hypothetical protein